MAGSEHQDQTSIKQHTGADLNLSSDFDRFIAETVGWNAPNALVPTGLTFQLFCLMLWQQDDRGDAPVSSDPRADALRDFFDNLFNVTERTHPHMLITRGLSFLNYLDAPPLEGPSLDIGCETGLTSKLLFHKPFTYGVDISPQWENQLRARGMHEHFFVGSGDAIPLPDASVRTIVMNNVLYHVRNRDGTLREAARCLEPGGRVYFDDLSPYFFEDSNRPFVTFLRSIGGRNFADEYMRRRNTMYMTDRTIDPALMIALDEYPRIMQEAGFTDVRAHYFHSRALLRQAYAFLDMGFIFGSGAIEPHGPEYRTWVKTRLAESLLRDRQVCAAEAAGGYIFVTARKPG